MAAKKHAKQKQKGTSVCRIELLLSLRNLSCGITAWPLCYENFCSVGEKNLLGLFFAWLILMFSIKKRWFLHMRIHGNKSKTRVIKFRTIFLSRSQVITIKKKEKKTIWWQFALSHCFSLSCLFSGDCPVEAPVALERKTSLHGWFCCSVGKTINFLWITSQFKLYWVMVFVNI